MLASKVKRDLRIEDMERIEDKFKEVLGAVASLGADGDIGRQVARIQQSVGFLVKYKSYAMKCASPLGYSVFFQEPGEGFSFQRHVTHKTEVFHILHVHPGGYVFLCDYRSWKEIYDPIEFAEWLDGKPDARYDQFRHVPSPGDIFVIDELNVVHAVVGCVLEEFATASTDMVDRLHDQNAGRAIPKEFHRASALERLTAVDYPRSSRVVYGVGAGRPRQARSNVTEMVADGLTSRVIADTFVKATYYRMDAGRRTPLLCDKRAASVYVVEGAGSVLIGDPLKCDGNEVPPTAVARGDLLTILPGIAYQAVGAGDRPLALVEHRIPLDVALAREP